MHHPFLPGSEARPGAAPRLRIASLATAIGIVGLAALPVLAADFHPIVSISSNTVDFFAVENLIEGPGAGFTAGEPHTRTGSTWVTDAPGGFPSDYLAAAGAPVLVIDLGSDVPLAEISVWGYSADNGNGAKALALRFATAAEGPAGFGDSIDYAPVFTDVPNDDANRLSFPFSRTVVARHVEVTITDNWFNEATGGTSNPPGGDRVGLGEIAFAVPDAGAGPVLMVPAAVAFDAAGGVEVLDITVENAGSVEPLVLADAGLDGPNADAFTVTTLPGSISAGGRDSILLTFDAGGLTGPVAATLRFSTNDPAVPTAAIPVEGFVHDPRLEAPASLEFGTLPEGTPAVEREITLVNRGASRALAITGASIAGSGAARFSIVSFPATIPPTGSATVTLRFDAGGGAGTFSGRLDLASNDPKSPVTSVALTARSGVPDPEAGIRINEIMASNDTTLEDGDGTDSDWIELHNPGPGAVDLDGWHLTDDAGDLTKWRFPPVLVPERGFLVVFASGKGPDYVDGDGYLHTNFRLGTSGEYLALVMPDGETVASAFAPAFPQQFTDVAYGFFRSGGGTRDLTAESNASALVPADGGLGQSWTGRAFTPGPGWITGSGTGVGFDAAESYLPFIDLDLDGLMQGINASAYIRIPFEIDDPSTVESLTLRARYDDGFTAWLNGTEIGSRNAPDAPVWNSRATTSHLDSEAVVFEDIDASEFLGALVAGTNVLAIQGMNATSGSSDFLIDVELTAAIVGDGPLDVGYLTAPTPGAPNSPSSANPGPRITDVGHLPAEPGEADPIVVTCRPEPRLAEVTSATLTYRIDFGAETSLPMRDDGTGGDAAAGDGVYTATIPDAAYGAGDLVRWFVAAEDADGNTSRAPAFLDQTGKNQSPEYFGAMAADPSIDSDLPVFHWFTQNVSASHTRSGTRASVWFLGRFYDNIFVRQRGGSTNGSVSQKFDFNQGDPLYANEAMPSVGEININGPGSDPTYVRQPLAFETYAMAGNATCLSELWLLRVNGSSDRVGVAIEQVDEDFLDRNGYDEDGDLYKFVQRSNLNPVFFDTITGIEKKTGDASDFSTVEELVAGLNQPTGDARRAFVIDHLDLPQIANYLAVRSITQDADDVRKNFYMFHDTRGDRRWRLFPWDKDWTFGITGDGGTWLPHPFFGDQEHAKQNANQWNVLYDVLFEETVTQRLYLRRLRTVMEEILQPESTPPDERILERRADEIFAPADPFLAGSAGPVKNWLPSRRRVLFNNYTNLIPGPEPADPDIAIVEAEVNPASGIQDEEFIRLANSENTEIDLSGWTLEGGVTFTFASGTVIPRNGSLHVSPDTLAFRGRSVSPKGGEEHLAVGPYRGHLSNFGEQLVLRDETGAEVSRFTTPSVPTDPQLHLAITELMYHPADPHPDAEFIELANLSDAVTLDLGGARFTRGIDVTIPDGTLLAPGTRILVVHSVAAFEAAYGAGHGAPIAGEFQPTRLDNDGETLKLEDATGSTILEFTYNDAGAWSAAADGLGHSLVVTAPGSGLATPDLSDPSTWRPSTQPGGNPGTSDTIPFTGDPEADADGNGFPDLVDYAVGSTTGTLLPAVVFPGDSPTDLPILAFERRLGTDDALVTPEISVDLATWLSGDGALAFEGTDPPADGIERQYWRVTTLPGGAPDDGRLFIRLRVESR